MTITVGGVTLPGATVLTEQTLALARDEQRAVLRLADGALIVATRYSAVQLEVGGAGLYPPALDGLDRDARHAVTAPALTPGAGGRTWMGYIIAGPEVSEDGRQHTARWYLTLRVSAAATLPALTIGGVAVPVQAQVEGVTIERSPAPGGRGLLQLSDGSAVPQVWWQRWRYRVSGSGWIPPGLTALDPAVSITLVSAPYGTVACWLVDGPSETWTQAASGPGYGWALTLQAVA